MALIDELRTLWLPGLHTINGRPQKSLAGLFASAQYQIYTPITHTSAELHFTDWNPLLESFAGDCARMSTAAIETIEGILPSAALPRSVAWLLVRSYYAAFFAAHAMERILGTSVLRIDSLVANAIDTIAALYGAEVAGGLQRGIYVCTANATRKTLTLKKLLGENTHESLWSHFADRLRWAADQILNGSGSKAAQEAAAKLVEVESILRGSGQAPKGNWLSIMRNRINYQQGHGTWFPYAGRSSYYDSLFSLLQTWKKDPIDISIWPQKDRTLQRFIEVCALLVSLCRVSCADMANRCPVGKSFHRYAALSLLDRLGA